MKDSHWHLKLEDYHFDAIVELLSQTLQELGIAKDLIKEIQNLLEPIRKDVVNPPDNKKPP